MNLNFREKVGGTTGGGWAGEGKRQWGGFAGAGPSPGRAGLPENIFRWTPSSKNDQAGEFGFGKKNASAWFPKAFAKHGHGPLGAGTGDTTMASLSPERQAEEMEGRRNVFGGVGEVQLPPGFFTGRHPGKASAHGGDVGGSPGVYVGGENTGMPGSGILNKRFYGAGSQSPGGQIDDLLPKNWKSQDYEIDDFGQDFGI